MAVTLMVSAVTCMEAASRKTKARSNANSGIVIKKGATHTYADGALKTQEFTYKRGDFSYKIEYPVGGNVALVNNMRDWIKTKMARDYSGSLNTPDGLIKKSLSSAKKNEAVEASKQVEISYSNDKIININYKDYEYWGGTHGRSSDVTASFSIADATPLTKDMLPFNSLRSYILQELAQDYDLDCLQIDEDIVDYGTPYVLDDDLHIIYGEYEIGPFAWGMPHIIFPLSQIRNLLSPGVINKYF